MIWVRVSKTKCDQLFFYLHFVTKLRFFIFPTKIVFQSWNFESNITRKISPLPRLWKRTNILNAKQKIKGKFQKSKGVFNLGGRFKCWSWCCPYSEESTDQWVSLRFRVAYLPCRTVPRDLYENSLCSFWFENPVQNTPAKSWFRLYQKLIIGPKNSIPQNRETITTFDRPPSAKETKFWQDV